MYRPFYDICDADNWGHWRLENWILASVSILSLISLTFTENYLEDTSRVSYASSPVWKQCPRSGTTSESYKPTFHGGHLSCNMSYGGAATIRIFRPPQRRYSYSTQSSITELLLSVSQHWNLCSGQQGFYYWNPEHFLYYQFVYKTSSYTVIC